MLSMLIIHSFVLLKPNYCSRILLVILRQLFRIKPHFLYLSTNYRYLVAARTFIWLLLSRDYYDAASKV